MKAKLERLQQLIEQLIALLQSEREENDRLRARLASSQGELAQAQSRLAALQRQLQNLNRLAEGQSEGA